MSRDWVYRQGHSLPFARHIGRRLVFSEQGLDKWLARRH
jgi:predicted DNA-binding transcriptional regulator AlpA